MNPCLTEEDVAKAAAGGGSEAGRAHLAACRHCQSRVEQEKLLTTLSRALGGLPGPPLTMQARVRDALLSERHVQGATKLVAARSDRRWRLAGAVAAGLCVAIVALLAGIVPEEEVSASSVLARSLATWSEPQEGEASKYELLLEGSARRLSPQLADGTSLVEQLVDHDQVGRYRVTCYGPDGSILAELAQDPPTGVRTVRLRVGERGYFFRFTMAEPPRAGPPEVLRSVLEAGIAALSASGDPKLSTFDVAEGRRYEIDLPRVTAEGPPTAWELAAARAVIDASDYRLLELEASGTFFGEEGRVLYRLLHREVRSRDTMTPAAFRVEPRPGDRELEGIATDAPGRDVLRALLQTLDAH